MINSIAILGGGTAGYFAALALHRRLPECRVSVVRTAQLPPIGVGESTTPIVPSFISEDLGVSDKELLQNVRPTWKLGVKFDWVPQGQRHFYFPFDLHTEIKLRGMPKGVSHYYFADGRIHTQFSEMMDLGRAPIKSDGQIQAEGGRAYGWAYHVENRPLIQFLEKLAGQRGIQILNERVVGVSRDPNGDVEQLQLDNGQSLAADLFVDCSGFAAELIGKELAVPFVDYSNRLFCDTAVTGSWERHQDIRPFTSADTMQHGWCWRVELADRVNRGYVFSSQFCNENDAIREFKERNPLITGDIHTLHFPRGRREQFWVNNVFAVGNAAGFVEPLEATGLHMIVQGVRALTQGLADCGRIPTPTMKHYINDMLSAQWDDICDFLAFHYKFNKRFDTPFWRHCRESTDLGASQQLLEFWQENGPSLLARRVLTRDSIFGFGGYLCMLLGMNVPTKQTFVPNAATRRLWEQHKQIITQSAASTMPFDNAVHRYIFSVQ